MAPLTRTQRRQSSNNEPLEAVAENEGKANGITSKSSNMDCGSDNEEELPLPRSNIIVETSSIDSTTKKIAPNSSTEDGGDGSDDEAPEAITMDSSKETAKKLQKEVSEAIQTQSKLARQKRKFKDAVLKEQREQAEARKRRRIDADKDKRTEQLNEYDSLTEAEPIAFPSKTQDPRLLPETILKKVSSRSLLPLDTQKKLYVDLEPVNLKLKVTKATKNRSLKDIFKKGPVQVKVLRNKTKAIAAMAPPAVANVMRRKISLIKGRVDRRPVGVNFRQNK